MNISQSSDKDTFRGDKGECITMSQEFDMYSASAQYCPSQYYPDSANPVTGITRLMAHCLPPSSEKHIDNAPPATGPGVQLGQLNMAAANVCHHAMQDSSAQIVLNRFLECSKRISGHLSELVAELSSRSAKLEELERFPEIEDFARRCTKEVSGYKFCLLCKRSLVTAPRWHIEGVHYEAFLKWLERKARNGVRRRLMEHRRKKKGS